MTKARLSSYSYYVTEKIDINKLNANNYIGVDNLLQNKNGIKISEYLPEEGTAIRFKKGDILLGNIRPYLKKIWLATFDGGCSPDVLCIRCKNFKDSKFIFSVLSDDNFFEYVMKGSKGTKMPRGDKNHIMNYSFIDIEGKDEIGNFIYQINEKILINNKINDNLHQFLMQIYIQKIECFNGIKPTIFDENLKRKIPNGWKAIKINQLASIYSGYPFDSSNYDQGGSYKLITIKNVQDSGIDLNSCDKIGNLPLDLPEYCKLSPGNILLSLTGNVGRVALMFTENCLLNQRVAIIHPKNIEISPYLYCLFKSERIRIKMERIAGGTSQKNLSPIDTENIYIPYNESLILEFSKELYPLFNKIINCLEENRRLIAMRNDLLPLLINGQVTID